MQEARVMGTAISTMKHESMVGSKLLIVQPYLVDGKSPDGFPLLALDTFGAGKGDTVIITSDGRAMRELLQADATPARWSVAGIKD
ncbi:MAG: EutN/CcmL family microcompartment protein [Planctomycetaceae bacterium]|nr:ethanolamine utilization protein EutN [Planctomycetaceae bacterium]|tara:strand:- start:271 stop:528 length:258 start_codon:yes stop_codon:yes gene_type:complete